MKTTALKSTNGMVKPSFNSTNDAIEYMEEWLKNDPNLKALLEKSLNKAKNEASNYLNDLLFNVLDWPTTASDYINYLNKFSRWIPQQSDLEAWKAYNSSNAQEVYDHLCHFYFLIDQKVGPNESIVVQSIKGFDAWLIRFANLWGDFLNTPESFSDGIMQTYIDNSKYFRIEDSLVNGKPNSPSGWLTFNQFFARELNPGLRPINSPQDNSVVVAPADCTYRMKYDIDANSNISGTTLKISHVIGNISDLLEDSPHANAFANGTFVHYFLGPYSYHRFHAPVSGIVNECRPVKGLTYLEVNIDKDKKQFDAPDDSDAPTTPKNGYEFNQARGILTIDASAPKYGNMGIVGVVPVGMCQVSGVHMIATKGKEIAKGEEFGYFLFGGSDIILLFQEGKAPVISEEGTSYRYYGTDISGVPNSPK